MTARVALSRLTGPKPGPATKPIIDEMEADEQAFQVAGFQAPLRGRAWAPPELRQTLHRLQSERGYVGRYD